MRREVQHHRRLVGAPVDGAEDVVQHAFHGREAAGGRVGPRLRTEAEGPLPHPGEDGLEAGRLLLGVGVEL